MTKSNTCPLLPCCNNYRYYREMLSGVLQPLQNFFFIETSSNLLIIGQAYNLGRVRNSAKLYDSFKSYLPLSA